MTTAPRSGSQQATALQPLLKVRGLVTEFNTPDGIGRAVNGLSFDVYPGETLAIVGESGCGKSITALSILQLVPNPPGRVVKGSAELAGRDLLSLSAKEINNIRGKDIGMIFQEPMTSLNPVLTVGYQIQEILRRHLGLSRSAAKARSIELLTLVKIPEPEIRVKEYPHQLSGGMRQRVMIAMALACEPQLLIADEPTTALDVTIQAQMLELIGELQAKLNTSVILITHDLGVVAETSDRVLVMYAGRKIEEAPVESLFADPQHPYTQGLLKSVPRLGGGGVSAGGKLNEIPGIVPPLTERIVGCAFAPRCPLATEVCREKAPPFTERTLGQSAACFHSIGGGQ
ncbi:MAG: ABC transporter ATP-binding protein [bacterium]|nr:ABC transporter ATP-binding protein [Gammaproteobacteria bacterium]HIL97669.1 ABC transporter ATP-binding protein [Pseudomonadales bacterium]